MQPDLEARQRKIAVLEEENNRLAQEAHLIQEDVARLNQRILQLKEDSEVNDHLIAELRLEGDRVAD